MKKYVKPELFFESYELSQQIAACDFDSRGTQNDESCFYTGVVMGETVTIFMNHCGNEEDQNVSAEGYCYHNTAGHWGIFNS